MTITSCYQCQNRHEKCHAHCEEYLTQKILKIMVEAQAEKERRIAHGITNQVQMQVNKKMHYNYLRRKK